jgi:hypothetical protein
MTLAWFGKHWGAPVCDEVPHVGTPVGEPCLWCGEPIVGDDNGFLVAYADRQGYSQRPMHEFCQLRSIVGGVAHLQGNCFCCGGDMPPDPPNASRREAAMMAAEVWHRSRRCDGV